MLIFNNEIPLAYTVKFVQGVYFALKRQDLKSIKALPSFWLIRAKTRENGAFYVSRPAEDAGKTMVFRESDRQTRICQSGCWPSCAFQAHSVIFMSVKTALKLESSGLQA